MSAARIHAGRAPRGDGARASRSAASFIGSSCTGSGSPGRRRSGWPCRTTCAWPRRCSPASWVPPASTRSRRSRLWRPRSIRPRCGPTCVRSLQPRSATWPHAVAARSAGSPRRSVIVSRRPGARRAHPGPPIRCWSSPRAIRPPPATTSGSTSGSCHPRRWRCPSGSRGSRGSGRCAASARSGGARADHYRLAGSSRRGDGDAVLPVRRQGVVRHALGRYR